MSRKNAAKELGICPVCKEQHPGRVLVQRTKKPTTTKDPAITSWIPVPTEGIELLNHHLNPTDEYRKEAGSEYVDHFLIFAKDDGSPIHLGAITKEFARLIREWEARLPTPGPHNLRHVARGVAVLAAGYRSRS